MSAAFKDMQADCAKSSFARAGLLSFNSSAFTK